MSSNGIMGALFCLISWDKMPISTHACVRASTPSVSVLGYRKKERRKEKKDDARDADRGNGALVVWLLKGAGGCSCGYLFGGKMNTRHDFY